MYHKKTVNKEKKYFSQQTPGKCNWLPIQSHDKVYANVFCELYYSYKKEQFVAGFGTVDKIKK